MKKTSRSIIVGALLSFVFLVPAWSQAPDESMRIITYYPIPAGTYLQVRAGNFAVGSAAGYRDAGASEGVGVPSITDGYAVVKSRVGLGITTPIRALEAVGNTNSRHTAHFRASNDRCVGAGGYVDGSGTPLSVGSIHAFDCSGGGTLPQHLLLNSVMGGNVAIGVASSAAYQLDIECDAAHALSCLGVRRLNPSNTIGRVITTWSGVGSAFYFQAIYASGPSAYPGWSDGNPLALPVVIKDAHIIELRARINDKRIAYSLPPYTCCGFGATQWRESIAAGSTSIKAQHIQELATALAQALVAASVVMPLPAVNPGDIIRADHINQLRAATDAI